MNDITPYTSSLELVADKIRWTIGILDQLVQRGRTDGWLDGTPRATAIEVGELARRCSDRLAATSYAVAPIHWLAARLGLGAVEVNALWLLSCIELSPAAARMAEAFGTTSCPGMTCQIVMELVPISSRQLDSLESMRLLEIASDTSTALHRRGIRVNDRVIDLARGTIDMDRELREIATVHGGELDCECPEELSRALGTTPAPLLVAIGPDGAGRATLLAAAAARAGHGTIRVSTSALARDPVVLERQLRTISREACLLDVIPLFEDLECDPCHPIRVAVEERMRGFPGPVLATSRESIRMNHRPVICHRVPALDFGGRQTCWSHALGNASQAVLDDAAQRYALRPGAIMGAARNVVAAAGSGEITRAAVHSGVRDYLGEQLGGLATRIEWRQTWDDLVLPVDQFEQVVELVARVRHRAQVLETWGFAEKIGKGFGLAALLSGPPGTGKTMAAGLIAQELGLDLYQVDLSKVVSKYIGETEKQLATLFDAAETGQAIILFDEADSLFAKRSEVRSSNDRYANLESNYLLQRVESFTGITLLTTNHESSIDDAFRRRLALHVRFPMPDEQQREQLWRSLLPKQADVSHDIDFAKLGRSFEMSGGYIKNAVLRAAYLAADAGTAIGMTQLSKGARMEYEGMGKVTFHHP